MEYIIAPPLSAEGAVLPVLWKMALTDLSLGSTKIYPSTAAIARYRVIQRDCHKWKCYQITLNQDFIDFWGIFRFHILGGLLFKATLNQSRHFWFLWPNFSYMIFFRPWNQLFCQATPTIPHFLGPGRPNSVGTYHSSHPYPDKTLMLLLLWKVPIRLLSGPFSACKAGFEAFFGDGHHRRESTPKFSSWRTKLGGIIWVTQKSTEIDQH